MSDNPQEETRIEFPEIHTYQFDKKGNHIYLCMYDRIMDKEYMILFDAYQFIDWFGTKEIEEIKENTIKKIKEL